MRIAILGAGPAGLYLAYLLKRARPELDVEIFEQNPPDATFGFGLAFSARALEFLGAEDAGTLQSIAPSLESWSDSVLTLNGTELRIDGMHYSGIGRLRLLEILQTRARSVGVAPRYGARIGSIAELEPADIIVGADGANSIIRSAFTKEFGTSISQLSNRFAWFGTRKTFSALNHAFVATAEGHFNAHYHPHARDMSTFVVEVDEATFIRCGFDTMESERARAFCERVFAGVLLGHELVSNNSVWRRFPKVNNVRWSWGKFVLMGDALRTVHFSIGSGTRLALEDAIALANAILARADDVAAAFAAYERARSPAVAALVEAADKSADWYEHFPEHMQLKPLDFAYSYVTRSGRVDLKRLRETSPEFVAAYERHLASS
jgi:2-polyprenyl-6-methoxyphenol hydroxylase-like FAD-dependent oxidoreductase